MALTPDQLAAAVRLVALEVRGAEAEGFEDFAAYELAGVRGTLLTDDRFCGHSGFLARF